MKNSKEKVKKSQKGITLIALIITIIVLLILAGITLNVIFGQDGILQKTTEAKEKNTKGEEKDQVGLAWNETLIDKRENGDNSAITAVQLNDKLKDYEAIAENGTKENEGKIKVQFEKTGNIYYIDENGKMTEGETDDGNTIVKLSETTTTITMLVESFKDLNDNLHLPSTKNVIVKKGTGEGEQQIVIPAGFKMAKDTGITLEEGMVIEDAGTSTTAGNQFVWVPVNQTITFTDEEEETGKIKLSVYSFGTKEKPQISESSERLEVQEKSVARNIEQFKEQTNIAKGYYMGRYEMGHEDNNNEICLCQKEKTAFYNITREQAKYKAQNLYGEVKIEDKIIYASDLMNNYSWYTAVLYIIKCTKEKDYAFQTGDIIQKDVLTGTSNDEKCKIHDMAKNVREWLTWVKDDGWPEKNIGGSNFYESDTVSGAGGGYKNSYYRHVGFRPILYILGLNE